jgi:hypothetical protein
MASLSATTKFGPNVWALTIAHLRRPLPEGGERAGFWGKSIDQRDLAACMRVSKVGLGQVTVPIERGAHRASSPWTQYRYRRSRM